MNIKKCTCGTQVTTKNAKVLGRSDFLRYEILFFNCPNCSTTLILKGKTTESEITQEVNAIFKKAAGHE